MACQATTKDIKDSLGKQWLHLSDKKRIKWITKSLEQQKLYEVRTLNSHSILLTEAGGFKKKVYSYFTIGDNARVHPATSTDEHYRGEHCQIHSDESRETAQRQV